jgi:hypothetical protein
MAVPTPDDRLIRQQQGGRPRIPSGITPDHFLQITGILEKIREDIESELTALGAKDDEKPKELHIRLNESGKPFPLPIFAGWVESKDVKEKREEWNHPHPGLHRFGHGVYSEIYGEAINYANNSDLKKHFRYRNWEISELLEKRADEKATDPKAGNLFQTCLAIVAQGRAVGTLVVGFKKQPPLLDKAQEVLREWARGESAGSLKDERKILLQFLDRFELGGPRLQDSDWWKFI